MASMLSTWVIVLSSTTMVISANPCPAYILGKTEVFKSACYEFVQRSDDRATWLKAQSNCNSFGGHLITVNDKETMVWLGKQLHARNWKRGCWIGAHKLDKDDEWLWALDGDATAPVEYSSWAEGQPSSQNLRFCVAANIKENWRWTNHGCGTTPEKYGYVCQYDGAFGFFNNPSNIIGLIVGLLVLVIVLSAAAVVIYKCYQRRKALRSQLQNMSYGQVYEVKISNMENSENGIEIDSAVPDKQPPPEAYGPVTGDISSRNTYNLNIVAGAVEKKKVREKDIESVSSLPSHLLRPEYSRSISAPVHSTQDKTTLPSAPPSCEDIDEDEVFSTEASPLNRPISLMSNDLS